MKKEKFNFEVELRYKNYCGEIQLIGVIGKFSSKGNADFCADALNKSNDVNSDYFYIVVEK